MPVIITSGLEKIFKSVLVVDANDHCILAWGSSVGSNMQIQVALLPFGGAWSAPTTIYTTALTEKIEMPSLEASSNSIGETVVAWTIFKGTDFLIKSAAFTP